MISSDHETPSVLMRRADEALYEAKHAGRNTFRMAS
jgi:PleD family two-component response regulator